MGAVPCTGPDCSLCKMFGMEGPSRRQMWWTKWSYRVKHLFRRRPKDPLGRESRERRQLRSEMERWEHSGEACRALGHVWTADNGKRCGGCGTPRV